MTGSDVPQMDPTGTVPGSSFSTAAGVRRLIPSRVPTSRRRALAGLLPHSGLALGSLCLTLDAALWLACFGLLQFLYVRWQHGAVELQNSVFLAQFVVIVGCLFIVGGYDRRTRFLGQGAVKHRAGDALRPQRPATLLSKHSCATRAFWNRRTCYAVVRTGEVAADAAGLPGGENGNHLRRPR